MQSVSFCYILWQDGSLLARLLWAAPALHGSCRGRSAQRSASCSAQRRHHRDLRRLYTGTSSVAACCARSRCSTAARVCRLMAGHGDCSGAASTPALSCWVWWRERSRTCPTPSCACRGSPRVSPSSTASTWAGACASSSSRGAIDQHGCPQYKFDAVTHVQQTLLSPLTLCHAETACFQHRRGLEIHVCRS